jgi:hypothetical protein
MGIVSGRRDREISANSMFAPDLASNTLPLIITDLSMAKEILQKKFRPGKGTRKSNKKNNPQKILPIQQNNN